jgi:hypothetical protein
MSDKSTFELIHYPAAIPCCLIRNVSMRFVAFSVTTSVSPSLLNARVDPTEGNQLTVATQSEAADIACIWVNFFARRCRATPARWERQ